ncbi:MAG: tRNA (N6-threonylcarbamoyladenosine(37)-N6)-methyltransferase TrmO [Oscillospiraceae bacterium]
MPEMKIIARIHTPFKTKFGVPRQSGIVEDVRSEIVFEPEYRSFDAVRGLEDYSHIWIVWQFSEAVRDTWSPTVRPPRLGGNVRVGVFATRSPFRPNAIGLSSLRLERVELSPERGPVLHVLGADMTDGTPIFDIKPYIPYADCHPDAAGGFTDRTGFKTLAVSIPKELEAGLPEGLRGVLENDPRPRYHDDPERVYGMEYAGFEVKFRVENGVLTVLDMKKAAD